MFFTIYTILLMVSGLGLILVGAAVSHQGVGMRILNILVGAAFLGYGFYLQFLFTGVEYRVFLYAFIGPALLIARTAQTHGDRRQAAAEEASAQARVDWEIAARQARLQAPPGPQE